MTSLVRRSACAFHSRTTLCLRQTPNPAQGEHSQNSTLALAPKAAPSHISQFFDPPSQLLFSFNLIPKACTLSRDRVNPCSEIRAISNSRHSSHSLEMSGWLVPNRSLRSLSRRSSTKGINGPRASSYPVLGSPLVAARSCSGSDADPNGAPASPITTEIVLPHLSPCCCPFC